MNIGELLNAFVQRELEEKRVRELLDSTTDKELVEIWDAWDCVSQMRIRGQTVGDHEIPDELRKRGIDPGI